MQLLIYLLNGFGLMKLSDKLHMSNDWLGFVPFARIWFLGKVTEECDAFAAPDKKGVKWGALYLTLHIVSVVAALLLSVLMMAAYVGLVMMLWEGLGSGNLYTTDVDDLMQMIRSAYGTMSLSTMIGSFVLGAIAELISVAILVVRALIDYRIFNIFAHKHAVWMLILAVILPVSEPILFMVLGFSDKFMPAVPTQPAPAQPAPVQTAV